MRLLKKIRKDVLAWSMYDFANQPFTTLIITFIYSTFFAAYIAEDSISGTVYWSRAATISAITVAIISPIMGAMADNGGYRKLFLIISTWICILGTIMLYFPIKGDVLFALSFFVIANIGFEMGCVFCNSYLPDLSNNNNIGKISGYGWSAGFLGGLIALFIAYFLFVEPETPFFGVSKEEGQNIRAVNLMIALWFAIFSLPTFFVLKGRIKKNASFKNSFNASFKQIRNTFNEVRNYKEIVKFLLARLVYNDALITVIMFGGIFAEAELGFSFEEIFILGIVLNLLAGIGSFSLGFLEDIIGSKKSILLSLIGLMAACILVGISSNKDVFWIAAILIGLFLGTNQSASRSLMARFTPANKKNEFFGFFAFSGKATAFVGPLLFGIVTQIFQTQRAGIILVLGLFLIGFILLLFVDEEKGKKYGSLN